MHYRPIEFYFWAVPLAALVAVALLYGIKHLILGRFVGDLPRVCRRCKYDLAGLTEPALCPECGRDLSERRAVRCGRRVRSPIRIATGLAVAIFLATGGYIADWMLIHVPHRELRLVSDDRLSRSLDDAHGSRRWVASRALYERVVRGEISDRALRRCIAAIVEESSPKPHYGYEDSYFGVHIPVEPFLQEAHHRGIADDEEIARIAGLFTAFRCTVSFNSNTWPRNPWTMHVHWDAHGWATNAVDRDLIFSLEVIDKSGNALIPGQIQNAYVRDTATGFHRTALWQFDSPQPGDAVTLRWRMRLHHPVTGASRGEWEQEETFQFSDTRSGTLLFRPDQAVQSITNYEHLPTPR